MQNRHNNQSGRSMGEMLGVLAVAGVISIGGVSACKLAMNHYRANQIAYEVNFMRLEAKAKIEQGAKELKLGFPYDENAIRYNGYPVAFGRVKGGTAEQYYIELPEIPEGICRPLTSLLNSMEDKAELKINGGKGCIAKTNNKLYVMFDPENARTAAAQGSGQTDEQINDKAELAEEAQAEPEEAQNCASSWDCPEDANGHKACISGKCQEECSGHDIGCASGTHCNSKTERCESNCVFSPCPHGCDPKTGACARECTQQGVECWEGYHCNSKTERCELCPAATPYWDAKNSACKTCSAVNSAQPAWDTGTKTCKTCYEVDRSKPKWNAGKSLCEACPEDTPVWDTISSQCVKCQDNGDCDGGAFCKTASCTADKRCEPGNLELEEARNCAGRAHTCEKADSSTYKTFQVEHVENGKILETGGSTKTYYKSNSIMNWWSADRYCKTIGKKLIELENGLACSKTQEKCESGSVGYALAQHWQNDGYSLWTNTHDACAAYIVYYASGSVFVKSYNHANNERYALCE